MRNFKNLISCFLTISLLLSALCTAAVADTAYLWGCALHNAGSTDMRWKSSIWNLYTSQSSSTVGGADYSSPQKLSSMDGGYLNKSRAPYVAWMVDAPEEGDYSVKPVYSVGSTSNSAYDSYNMVISVNDEDYYTCQTISYTGSTQWIDNEEVTVHLNKGVNVIRMLSSAADNYPSNVWIDINCLYVDARCSLMQCFGNELTLNAGNAQYINNWPSSNGILCNVSSGNSAMRKNQLGYGNIMLSSLPDVCYFSYTVEAPQDGYYDMSMLYNIGGTTYADNAEGYFVVRVGGTYYKRSFINTKDGYNTANISVPLKKGTNVVLVSCAIDVSTYYTGHYNGYPDWCDVSTVTFYGGVTKSSVQIDPLTVEDDELEEAVIDAENYGILNRYSISGNEIGVKSGKHIAGGMNKDTTNMQSLSSMQGDGWLDKSQIPYVTYLVNASAGGDYTLGTVYRPQMNDGYSNDDYYMVVSVNDKYYYKAYFKQSSTSSVWSDSQVTVRLDKGVNTIRCMSVVAENADSVSWLNQDCIYIKGTARVEAVLPKLTHLQSADSDYINGFAKGETNSNAAAWYVRQLNDYRGKSISGSAGLTFDNLTSRNMKYLCYFSYTVDVPADGYYDMSTYISTGSAGATGYIILVIDGNKYKYSVKDSNNNLGTNRSNISTYFKKGTHTVAISGIFEHSAYMNTTGGYTDWCNMGALSVSGGITKSDTQIDPLTLRSDSESGNYGLITGSVYKTDSQYSVSGVATGTTAFMFKNNFKNPSEITVSLNGNALSDTDFVKQGVVADYGDGIVYTVDSVVGDVNNDGKFDVRDLKVLKEYCFGNVSEINTAAADISGDGKADENDAKSFSENIVGAADDIYYKPMTLGAPTLMNYANPVGRLTVNDNSVMMESSASNFTVSGYMKGDVTATLYENKIQGDEMGIFIEVDGDTDNPTYIVLKAGIDTTVKLASGLTAGFHKIKVSKSTDAKNDDLFVSCVNINGRPSVTAAAEHRIEFIGDSITAGYAAKYPKTTSYYTYANYTADRLGADYYSVANGGWRFGSGSNCLTNIYTKVSMQVDLGNYDFSYNPEIVVINVGTNDGSNPSATDQQRMLTTVRQKNPNATIIWAYGMINHTALNQIKTVVENFAKTDKNTYFVTLPQSNDGTDNWHTGPAGHAAAAKVLSEYIANLKGWELK